MINFRTTPDEFKLIGLVVVRAASFAHRYDYLRRDLLMDLTACNANGMPLDFEKLLSFDDFSFTHDVLGIRRYINRDTGQLTGFFVPRCARPERSRQPNKGSVIGRAASL